MIKGKLLLWSYEPSWVVQYGEIGNDLLFGAKFVKLEILSASFINLFDDKLGELGEIYLGL